MIRNRMMMLMIRILLLLLLLLLLAAAAVAAAAGIGGGGVAAFGWSISRRRRSPPSLHPHSLGSAASSLAAGGTQMQQQQRRRRQYSKRRWRTFGALGSTSQQQQPSVSPPHQRPRRRRSGSALFLATPTTTTAASGLVAGVGAAATNKNNEEEDPATATNNTNIHTIQSFLSHMQTSVERQELQTFVCRGVKISTSSSSSSSRAGKRQSSAAARGTSEVDDSTTTTASESEQLLLGCLVRISGRPWAKQTPSYTAVGMTTMMMQVTFKYHGATDIVHNWPYGDTVQKLRSILLNDENGDTIHKNNNSTTGVAKDDASSSRTSSSYSSSTIEVPNSEWGPVAPTWFGSPPYGIRHAQFESVAAKTIAVGAELETVATTTGAAPPTTTTKTTTVTTTTTTWELSWHKTVARLKQKQQSSRSQIDTSSNSNTVIPQQQHNRILQSTAFVDVSFPVWQALGVTTVPSTTTSRANKVKKGSTKEIAVSEPTPESSANNASIIATAVVVKPNMASKVRQCQKFVEIVDRLVTECLANRRLPTANSGGKILQTISIVDMGCGRAYLTFALHLFLTQKYNRNEIVVSSRGLDVRPKLIQEISAIATTVGGPELEHLTFETRSIESFLSETTKSATNGDDDDDNINKKDDGIQVLIALHACDTATDDALWSAIAKQVDVIVVAPCCHQQIRPQLNQYLKQQQSSATKTPQQQEQHPYMDVLRHNIYRERVAETVTDSLRALLLEYTGLYTVQVFEFIGGEHTSKNVMIAAVKRAVVRTPEQQEQERLLTRIQNLAQMHGIRHQQLAEWMGVALTASPANYEPVYEYDVPGNRKNDSNGVYDMNSPSNSKSISSNFIEVRGEQKQRWQKDRAPRGEQKQRWQKDRAPRAMPPL